VSLRPVCVWITGLAGSGKTTLAEVIVRDGRAAGEEIVWLDGDLIRNFIGARSPASYTQEGRKKLSLLYGELCSFFLDRGFSIVMSTIAMHPGVSKWNRENIPGYFEVFLSVPAATLHDRDKNGLYSGMSNVVGVDIDATFPESPDLTVEMGTSGGSVNALELGAVASNVLDKSGMRAGSYLRKNE
jgi:adenylylsulfate kinase